MYRYTAGPFAFYPKEKSCFRPRQNYGHDVCTFSIGLIWGGGGGVTFFVFISGVNDTGEQFIAGDNDTGDKFIARDKNKDAMEVGSCQR